MKFHELNTQSIMASYVFESPRSSLGIVGHGKFRMTTLARQNQQLDYKTLT